MRDLAPDWIDVSQIVRWSISNFQIRPSKVGLKLLATEKWSRFIIEFTIHFIPTVPHPGHLPASQIPVDTSKFMALSVLYDCYTDTILF